MSKCFCGLGGQSLAPGGTIRPIRPIRSIRMELLLSRPTLVRFGTLGELTLGSSSATADRPLRWMRHRNGCAR
jgi:hypothetical protein